jgi:ArsR family transcriptional regulator, arsenate/arsenite/antimonite-responsive transcriptional repressor
MDNGPGGGSHAVYWLDVNRTTGYTDIVPLEVTVRDAAQFFKILADEARLKILWLLFNHRELCVCDIIEALGITQSKASRHLATLRHANLVTDRKEGLWSYYALRPVEDDLARQYLDLLKSNLGQRSDAVSLLGRLHEWLLAKNRGAVCTPDSPCAAAKSKTTKRTRKAPHPGGNR